MKGMSARFNINNRVDGCSVVVDVHEVSIDKIEPNGKPSEYEPGKYVAVHVHGGTDEQSEFTRKKAITMLLSKPQARAIASAIMGEAAQL